MLCIEKAVARLATLAKLLKLGDARKLGSGLPVSRFFLGFVTFHMAHLFFAALL